MQLDKLSATSGKTYEACPSRWEATYLGPRPPEQAGPPAMKGTVCHYALEMLVSSKTHTKSYFDQLQYLLNQAEAEYTRLFKQDRSHWDDCVEMLTNWANNTGDDYWLGREILSTELRKTFDVKTTTGVKPFTYICDRVDILRDFAGTPTIEVIDYKTYRSPTKTEGMRDDLQVRAYAVAMFMQYSKEYPDLAGVKVTLDLLRYSRVSVIFTREECLASWRYIRELSERIIADVKPKETINEDCMYCVKRMSCKAILAHASVGGALAITDVDEAADAYFYVSNILKTLKANQDDLKGVILKYCEVEDLPGFSTDTTSVTLTSRKVQGKFQTPFITAKQKKGKTK